jgi:Asp-tRNA(Asn)/Glu-tRNA(Gln) amidotransferase A subunit family amidase
VYRDRVNALFQHWDVLIAPATPVAAPGDRHRVAGHQRPAPALPPVHGPADATDLVCRLPRGGGADVAVGHRRLPIGVQVIAAPWREDLALRAAMVLQQMGRRTSNRRCI